MEKAIFFTIGHGKIYLAGTSEFQTTARTNQLPGDDLISLLCGIVSFCTDRELTRSTSPIVFQQSTIPRGLRVCVVKRKRWFNCCFSYLSEKKSDKLHLITINFMNFN